MLINTFLDTEDFVHLYYPEDEPPAAQGCGAGARMASKYPPRPPSPEYKEVATVSSDMSDRERYRAPPQPEPPPHRVRASDLYPRQRTHYDEPGLDAGFAPICGEFVQWVGRTSDGGTIAMSNYRLHLQPRRRNGAGSSVPLRLIDALEIRDLLCLIVLCKHGRQLKCSFNTGEQCLEWWRRLGTALTPITSLQETFAAAYAAWAKEQPPSSVHRALMSASHAPQRHWFGPELERLGFSPKGPWRVTAANAEYKLCSSYPPLLIVPATIGDEQLESVARFRAMRRIPAVVWRHRGTGAVIARSSQPEVGWFGWRSSDDEGLLAAFVAACNADKQTPNKQLKLLIVDARSFASAVTNRARGGGCECQQYYPHADIQFMSLPNIHHVRKSFHQLRALVAEPSDQANWHSNLERTLWPQYLSGIARAASGVARAVSAGRPVLVHCSDGWDRTPQLVAAAQLLLDPHYRTLEGFRTLIEREWLDFGHKFAERCGHQVGGEDPNERSPIFLQWLHLVYQLMLQFPCAFEFNEAYLIKLATHVHSCMFGTFLCNSRRERADCAASTPHVWHLLAAPAYRNHLYAPNHDQVIWPECSVRSMQIWWGGLGGAEGEGDAEGEARALDPPPAPLAAPTLPHNGFMTKTRSCDNLLSEGEKRTTQRRCSDPSIAPDVIKLSLVVNGRSIEGEKEKERSECGVALTDSCVDALPQTSLTQADSEDQTVSLHPDYFDSQPRDITSNSSSLERELASVAEDKQMDVTRLVNGDVCADVTGSGTPVDERHVFDCDLYTDVIEMADTSREVGRTRNISITWRSISESSNQSSTGFDIPENSPQSRLDPSPPRLDQIIDNRSSSDRDTPTIDNRNSSDREMPIIDNCNSTEGDIVNHNVVNGSTNHNRENGVSNGAVNGVVDVTAKFLEVELNGGGVSSSGASSESDGETREIRTVDPSRGSRVPSQLTLCPASPRRPACCHCSSGRSWGGACWCGACGAAGEGAGGAAGAARCVCGAGAARAHHSLDGLPPADNPLQARLHQIILYQKKVVEELSGQLREAREALRRASPPAPPAPRRAHAAHAARPAPPDAHTASSSGSGSGSGSSGASGSSSGSASEVEVGEEARGVVWLPDSAAPRCQHCRNPFWLARRRHHCRLCGGIFCGSCSEMSSWGEVGAVRVCRRCRALR